MVFVFLSLVLGLNLALSFGMSSGFRIQRNDPSRRAIFGIVVAQNRYTFANRMNDQK